MIIFNSTDHPILVKIGEREFFIEPNRYNQEEAEQGRFPLTVCKMQNGKPLTFYKTYDKDWGVFSRKGIVSLAAEGEIEVNADTKLHIEEQQRKCRLRGYGKYTEHLEHLSCIVENGAIDEVRSVFATPAQRSRLVNSLRWMLGVIVFFHAIITLVPLAAWNDPDAWWLVLLFQILFVIEEWQSIRALRILKPYSVAENKTNCS